MSKIPLKEYRNLIEHGRKLYNKYYTAYVLSCSDMQLKTAASKRTGKAVQRNYEKRVLRTILGGFQFKEKLFVLIILIRPCNQAFSEKRQLLNRLLQPYLLQS